MRGMTGLSLTALPAGAARLAPLRSAQRLSPLWGALLVLTILTVSRVHQSLGALGRLRPALLLFILCVIFALLYPRDLAARNLRTWQGRVVIGLAVVACLSALFGLSLGGSARFFLDSYSKTLVYAGLLFMAMRGVGDLRRLVWAVVLAGGILAFMSLFVVGISKTSQGQTYDANDVALIMNVALPLTVLTFQTSTGAARWFSAVSVVLVVATVARSESRGGFVGLLAVGLAMFLMVRGVSLLKRLALVGVATASLMIAAPTGYWDLMRTLQNPTEDYNWDAANGRKALSERGVGYMLDHPVFGIGLNNFARAEGTISSKAQGAAAGTGIRWAAAHNSYVQAGAELGVPGLLLWVTLIVGTVRAALRLRRKIPSAWARGSPDQRFVLGMTMYLPVAVVGFAVAGFFVSFAYQDPIYILAAMGLGLEMLGRALLAGVAPAGSASTPGPRRPGRGGWSQGPRHP